jgi:hypothetical protein
MAVISIEAVEMQKSLNEKAQIHLNTQKVRSWKSNVNNITDFAQLFNIAGTSTQVLALGTTVGAGLLYRHRHKTLAIASLCITVAAFALGHAASATAKAFYGYAEVVESLTNDNLSQFETNLSNVKVSRLVRRFINPVRQNDHFPTTNNLLNHIATYCALKKPFSSSS